MKHNSKKTAYLSLVAFATATLLYAVFLIAQPMQLFAQAVATTQPSASKAADAAELQRKIDERNRTIVQLTKEIKEYQDLADKTSKEALSLQGSIKKLEATGKSLDLDIRRIKEKIEATSLDITRLNIVISESEESIDLYKNSIAENIREIDDKDRMGVIEIFLSEKSLSSLLNEVDQLFQINKRMKELNQQLSMEKKKYESNKQTEITRKDELVKLQSELAGKKKVIEYNKNEQTKILSVTKNEEKTFQEVLKQKQALKASFEKEVFDYESQLKYTLDPSKLPKVGSSPLSWPLDKVVITQRFGKTVSAKRLYVSGSHNGVDFGTRTGTPVKAMASGVVLGAGDTDITCPGASFGRWILIKFDNGLAATYGHLSVINVKQGQTVTLGEVIGYSGNTGYSTGPHLHITVYPANGVSVQNRPSASCGGRIYTMPIAATEAYLDPMLYFPQ
ncbi:MAG: hypothetical protein RL094_489 [Candidatus Parcubacteria bacterium]|jgi:murein DD-endopeptidase MepM/ murein hydrolase activator NlpD